MKNIKKYPHLFSPLRVGSLTLRNRIASAPTSYPELTADGLFTKDCIWYYKGKAKGGAAMVTIGETSVHHATGKAHPKHIVFDIMHFAPAVFPALCEAADAITDHGAVASIELSHNGAYVDPQFIGGRNPVGPSAFVRRPEFPGQTEDVYVEEMSERLIIEVVEAFANAAAIAKRAGFNMVTIHAAHGWLITQFLSPASNHRTDRWGGSLENRARFLVMILDRIKEKCGPDFPVEVRLSGSEVSDDGYGIEEGIAIARMIEPRSDLLHVSAGNMLLNKETTSLSTFPSAFVRHGPNVGFAEAIKRHVNIPVTTVGGLYDLDAMEEIVASGRADMVAMARQLIADPFLPRKANLGRSGEIRPCLQCYVCQEGIRETNRMKCSVNPVIGREFETFCTPGATDRKKVLVAGGGVAGMQAAITAAERGHEVTLYEKGDSLGGMLKESGYADFKQNLHNYIKYMIRTVGSQAIKVKLGTAVTAESVALENPDVLIAALGSEPIVPDIPGVDNKIVVRGVDIHIGVELGDTVVIIGAGMVGCEAAVWLAREGKHVVLLEMLDDVATDVNNSYRLALLIELKKEGVDLRPGLQCTQITDKGVIAMTRDGKEEFEAADTVVVAVGMKPRMAEVKFLRDAAPEFFAIGDCVKPGKILQAARAGYNAAMDI